MKRLLFLVLILSSCVIIQAQNKNKTIKIGSKAVYTGAVEKKTPMGEGTFVINDNTKTVSPVVYKINGVFNGSEVTNGTFILPEYKIAFTGNLSYSFDKVSYTINLLDGIFYYPICKETNHTTIESDLNNIFNNNSMVKDILRNYDDFSKSIEIGKNNPDGSSITIFPGDKPYVSGTLNIITKYYIPNDKLALAKEFAKDNKFEYSNNNGTEISATLDKTGCSWKINKKQSDDITLLFDNGTTISLTNNKEEWKRPNGDYIIIFTVLNSTNIEDYNITIKSGIIKKNSIEYSFTNGNKYLGTVKDDHKLADLISLENYNWAWEDFLTRAINGKLIYSDGEWYEGDFYRTSINDNKLPFKAYYNGVHYKKNNEIIEKYINGVSETEIKRKEEEDRRIARMQAEKYEVEKLTDFYEFNEKGFLVKFKKAFYNGVLIGDLTDRHNSTNKYIKFIYENGDTLKFYNMSEVYDGILIDYDLYVNEWFSKLSDKIMAPEVNSSDFFSIDKSRVACVTSLKGSDHYIRVTEGVAQVFYDNGDYFHYMHRWNPYDGNSHNYFDETIAKNQSIQSIKKTFNDYSVNYAPDEITYPYLDNSREKYMRGEIVYDNGTIFKGILNFEFTHPLTTHQPTSLSSTFWSLLKLDGVWYWFDEITAAVPYDGLIYDVNNKIIDAYKKGKKLNDFEKASVIAAEQGKIDAEKKKIADYLAQKERIINKFGKKNADALYNGKIIIGMQEELFLMGIDNGSFNRIAAASLSKDYGDTKCYDLYGVNNSLSMIYLGHIWITNGAISSIHYL